MKAAKDMHPQSAALIGIIRSIPGYSLDRFLDDMEIVPERPQLCKNWIKISKVLELLDISKPFFYKLAKQGVIKIRYIDGDPNNARVKEADVLGLMEEIKDSKRKRTTNRYQKDKTN